MLKKEFTLEAWLNWLNSRVSETKIHYDLNIIQAAAESLALNHTDAFVFTVAGTNGKGSTVECLTQMLVSLGVSVGTYTSPHLLYFQERIRINGVIADDKLLSQGFYAIYQSDYHSQLSYFEYVFLVSLWIFKKVGLKALVLEVGIGGRLDATNIIDTDVAIITSIGLDHQYLLGHTVEMIAQEKAGIIRKEKPLVLGHTQMADFFKTICEQKSVPLYVFDQHFFLEPSKADNQCEYKWKGVTSSQDVIAFDQLPKTNLISSNIACAIQALCLSHFVPNAHIIKQVLTEKIKLVGRGELYKIAFTSDKIMSVFLDVAHNPQAMLALVNRLKMIKKKDSAGRIFVVFAMCYDKDYHSCIKLLHSVTDYWFISEFNSMRQLSVLEVEQSLRLYTTNYNIYNNVVAAFEEALCKASSEDYVIVTGSFITVSEVLNRYQKQLVRCKPV